MEEVTQSIKQELATLDQNIITLEKALELTKQQKNRDKEQLRICIQKRKETSGILGRHTINCDDLDKAYYGYSFSGYHNPFHEYKGHFEETCNTIILNKNHYTHSRLKNLLMKGSFYRYLGIKLSLKKDKRDHKQFQDDFARSERTSDLEYLQILKENIQKNNQKIQARNSCLSNRS